MPMMLPTAPIDGDARHAAAHPTARHAVGEHSDWRERGEQDEAVDVTIGPTAPDEASVLTALHHQAALHAFAKIFPPDAPPPSFEADRERWQRWLGPGVNEGTRVFVARVPIGKVVGVVLAAPDPDEPAAGHLARLYVHPDYWGRRIGTGLYDAAIAELSSRFREATLRVLEGNSRARSWYERLGWEVTTSRKTTYAPAGIDDVQYRTVLHHRR